MGQFEFLMMKARRNMKFAQLNGLQISEDQVKDLQKQIDEQKWKKDPHFGNGGCFEVSNIGGLFRVSTWKGTDRSNMMQGPLFRHEHILEIISRLQGALNGKFCNE